jgi:hypothetical protein
MSKLPLVLLLILCVSVYPQSADLAHATYGRTGQMVGLADLAPLRDCRVRSADGKARAIRVENGVVTFDLRAPDKSRQKFRFPLSMLDRPERKSFRRGFLQKGVRLRASGYACGGPEEPLEAISIYRSY